MKKTGIVAMVLIGWCGPASVLATENDDCVSVAKSVSDLQLALAGMGNLDERVAKVDAMSERVPAFEASLSSMVGVVEDADAESPLETIEMEAFDRAEAGYQEAYREECGEL